MAYILTNIFLLINAIFKSFYSKTNNISVIIKIYLLTNSLLSFNNSLIFFTALGVCNYKIQIININK